MRGVLALCIVALLAGCAADDVLKFVGPAPEPKPPSNCPTSPYPTDAPLMSAKAFPLYENFSLDTMTLPQTPGQLDNAFRIPTLTVRITPSCGTMRIDRIAFALTPEAGTTWTSDVLPTSEHPNGADPAHIANVDAFSDPVTARAFLATGTLSDPSTGTATWSFDLDQWRIVEGKSLDSYVQIGFSVWKQQYIPPFAKFDLSVAEVDWTDEESGAHVNGDRTMDVRTHVIMAD